MFPDKIAIGYVLTIAGNAYVVESRAPDAFVTRSLDVGSHVVTFSFDELDEVHREGMLRIEPPRPASPVADGRDALWRVVCETFESLRVKGRADLTNASVHAVMPHLLEAQVRHLTALGIVPTADYRPTLVVPSPSALRARMLRHDVGRSREWHDRIRNTRDPLAFFDPAVAEITRECALLMLSHHRPTLSQTYLELRHRLYSLPKFETLRIPSMSMFRRVVMALPCDPSPVGAPGARPAARPLSAAPPEVS